MCRQRKWTLAGRAASSEDGRWTGRILLWKPWFRVMARRCVGRPAKRWDEDLVALAGGNWPESARNELIWDAGAIAYIDHPA